VMMDPLIDRGEYAALAHCTYLNQASLGLIPRTSGGDECPVLDRRGPAWQPPSQARSLATAAAGRRVMASLPRRCRPCVSRRGRGFGVDQGGDYRVAAQPVQAP